MEDVFVENKEISTFYNAVRVSLSEILLSIYQLEDDALSVILNDLDALVSERTKKISVFNSSEDQASEDEEEVDITVQIESLKNGIFNLVVTLCLQYANDMSQDNARMLVVDYLHAIIDGLNQLNQTEEGQNA